MPRIFFPTTDLLRCDDHGEDWKQGGHITYGCMNFTINPNPIYWLECAPSLSHARSRARDTLPKDAALLDAPALLDTGHKDVVPTTISIQPGAESSSFTALSSDGNCGEPTCYNTCYGITRLDAGIATNVFASSIGDKDMTTSEDFPELKW